MVLSGEVGDFFPPIFLSIVLCCPLGRQHEPPDIHTCYQMLSGPLTRTSVPAERSTGACKAPRFAQPWILQLSIAVSFRVFLCLCSSFSHLLISAIDTPHFIALCITALHRCRIFYKLKAKPSTSKRITICLIGVGSGTEPTISQKYACISWRQLSTSQ